MHRRAINHLRKVDPVMRRVIDQVGSCTLTPRNEGTHFDSLARAIVYQQLSGKAAATIHARVSALFPDSRIDPERLPSISDAALRGAGLSRQKIGYLRDLAAHTVKGTVRTDDLHELDDDEIAEQLLQVKGVGIWTVQMFLMFRLGRPDVLPGGDLGIRKGMQRAYRMRKLPEPKRVEEVGAKWAPHRTVASWYLWRVLELDRKPARKKVRRVGDA